LFCLPLLAASCSRPVDDHRAVREQVANNTKVLDTETSAWLHAWSNTKDVSAITPMGQSLGWDEGNGMYQFFADNFADRHLQAPDITAQLMGDTAWVEYNWHCDVKIKPTHGDSLRGAGIRGLRKIGGGWRIVYIHYSGLAMAINPGLGFQ
jgi:hypothetical protein